MSAARAAPATLTDVACPFCGLLCDDLTLRPGPKGIGVEGTDCPLAAAGFGRAAAGADASPRIRGRQASAGEAVAEAARLLGAAQLPLVAGLATDVAGAQAAARLVDRLGGILDHMNSAGGTRNLLALQDGGWVATTLTEIRNRCDLLIVVGGDLVSRYPRFFERTVAQPETLFGSRVCEVVFLGPATPPALPGLKPRAIGCDLTRLAEGFGVLRALVAGRTVSGGSEAAGVPLDVWRSLAAQMEKAGYGVIAWAAADLDFPHAELAIQGLCDLVKDLNQTTRFAGLPLGGSDGDLTADSVHLWQTGSGLRTGMGRGHPEQDLYHFAGPRLLERGEADVLLWISSFDPARQPPAAEVPTVVLGAPGMAFTREPEVFIPVGTPGVHHAGHLFRTDRVVALPLSAVHPSPHAAVADVLAAIEAALAER